MPRYVMLTKLTDDGAKTIRDNPGRIMEVDREMEEYGIKIVMQLATLGEYDFVNILDAPDNLSVARASIDLSRRGTLRVLTLPAIEMAEFTAALSD